MYIKAQNNLHQTDYFKKGGLFYCLALPIKNEGSCLSLPTNQMKEKNQMRKNEFNLHLLVAIFSALLVCANCIAAKQIYVGDWFNTPVSITVGIICYPITFLITDIIGEIWGKKAAQSAVIWGLTAQIFAIVLVILANIIPGNDDSVAQMFDSILGSNWILTISSLVACAVSQTWDVFVFHKIRDSYIAKHKTRKGGRWIWNNASTITSQLFDSVIFYVGLLIMLRTQGVILPFKTCVITILVYWLIKIVIAICDTPLFYIFTNQKEDKNNVNI